MSELAKAQRVHWDDTYTDNPGMYGDAPSMPARHAATVFTEAGARRIIELGAGHGRDTMFFARNGFHISAFDVSATGLAQLSAAAETVVPAGQIRTTALDVRNGLPAPDDSADAVFAHMLLCMALSTKEIHAVVAEARRVLRPGGVFMYTVRHTGDTHYRVGTAHGDDIYETGGFAVHFFSRKLVDNLAEGWHRTEVHDFTEGALPRRLWRVTQTVPE